MCPHRVGNGVYVQRPQDCEDDVFLRRGERILGGMRFTSVDMAEEAVLVCTEVVQVRLPTGFTMVTRESMRDAMDPIVTVARRGDDVLPNCTWVVDAADPGTYDLVATRPFRCTEELHTVMGWVDMEPQRIPARLRDEMMDHYWTEIGAVENTSIRHHIWRLAEGFRRWSIRLCSTWGINSPPPEAIASVDQYSMWAANEESKPSGEGSEMRLGYRYRMVQQEVDSDARYIASKRAKARRRRLKDLNKVVPPAAAQRGWEALEAMAVLMRDGQSVISPEFVALLADLDRKYNHPQDFTDSSETVQAMVLSGELTKITKEAVAADEHALAVHGLEGLHRQKVASFSFIGLDRTQLRAWLRRRCPQHEAPVMKLLEEGQKLLMKGRFKTNGHDPPKNNANYWQHRAIVEHNAATLHRAGKCVLVRKAVLSAEDLKRINFIKIHTVEKKNSIPRVVHHLSYGTKRYPSFNESIDWVRHLQEYPRPVLPTLSDLADACHRLRVRYPN